MPSRTAKSNRQPTNDTRASASAGSLAAVVLSGGAPNGAMMAGALAAIYEGGKTFNTFYTSGAGALIGMLYVAPKTQKGKTLTPAQSLALTKQFGIEDEIYNLFPVGYKTFYKSGPFTRRWIGTAQAAKLKEPDTKIGRLYNDMVDFWAAATCPTDLTYFSEGICANFPFLKEFIDFEKIRRSTDLQFFMNAHHVESTRMVEFSASEITEDHFDATFSYPFIYSSKVLIKNGVPGHYFEGGCVDPLNLSALFERIKRGLPLRTVVIMDILGSLEAALVRVPRNLWDAYGISIMLPVVSLARMSQEIFDLKLDAWNQDPLTPANRRVKVFKVTFDVPKSMYPYVVDWSASNMTDCWDIGYKAGQAFLAGHANLLPDHQVGLADPVTSGTGATPRRRPPTGVSARAARPR